MPSSDILADLRGRSVTVFGLGREGVDLARLLAAEGAHVRVTDQKRPDELSNVLNSLAELNIAWSLGGHPSDEVLAADLLFVSPGISRDLPVLAEARRRRIPMSSVTELFFARCPACIIGITGSSGKSTTTALVGEMLAAAGREVVVGGNIGTPLLGKLCELRPESLVVMELSSFQLETIDRAPAIATITNITPNHLDRHGSMKAYAAAKERIFRFQKPTDWTVLNADDPFSAGFRPPGRVAYFSLERPVTGAYVSAECLCVKMNGRAEEVCSVSDLALRGRHNLANALAACATAWLAGASIPAMRTALRSFRGLPHRLEKVGERAGVSFYDDSIATSPERSMAALRSFSEPMILLAGGRDKHLPMDSWAGMIRQRAAGVVLFGEARGLIQSALTRAAYPAERIKTADSLPAAVRAGFELATAGQVVLLSPGCTSYDMFQDFVERGEVFTAAVRELTGKHE